MIRNRSFSSWCKRVLSPPSTLLKKYSLNVIIWPCSLLYVSKLSRTYSWPQNGALTHHSIVRNGALTPKNFFAQLWPIYRREKRERGKREREMKSAVYRQFFPSLKSAIILNVEGGKIKSSSFH